MSMDLGNVSIRIQCEINSARAKYGPFTSTHEGLGVLMEEMKELVDAIHANDIESVCDESIQIAAVAYRLAGSCEDPYPEFRKRSTGR